MYIYTHIKEFNFWYQVALCFNGFQFSFICLMFIKAVIFEESALEFFIFKKVFEI
mgnify:FL=1